MKAGSIIFLFYFCLLNYNAKSQISFKRTYGFSLTNEGKSVVNATDGGYLIAGTTSTNNSDGYVIKLDANGNLQWQKTYGGSGVENINSIINTNDSSYVMVGFTNANNANNVYDILLIKIDQFGNELWQKQFGGNDWSFGNELKQLSDSGFIIAGQTYNGSSGNADGIFLRTDANGDMIWQKILSDSHIDNFSSVDIASDGGFIAAGTRTDGIAGNKDIIAAKVNSTGDSVWYKSYGTDSIEEAFDMIIRNGTVIITGANRDDQKLNNLTFRISENGDSLSTVLLSHPEDEITTSIDSAGINYWVTGYTSSFGAGKKEMFISKIDSLGNDIHGTTFGGVEDEVGNDVKATNDGGAIIVGYSQSYLPGNQSVFIVKIDSSFNPGSLIIGINELTNQTSIMNIYPNPVHESFNISLPEEKSAKVTVEIFDTQGRKIKSFHDKADKIINIERGNILSGEYSIIILIDGNPVFSTKLIFD